MNDSELTATEVAAQLELDPLPGEGGWFRRTYADDNVSSILYLLGAGDGFSALHRLTAPEIYTFAAGAPAELLLLDDDGPRLLTLGSRLDAGDVVQAVVPAGTWQGSSTTGAWTLVTATMAPPYTDDRFELATAAVLIARWPDAATRIATLTR